jgi:hypothetical protein
MNPHENELNMLTWNARGALKGKRETVASPIIVLEMGRVSTNPHGWFMNVYDIGLQTVSILETY